MSYCRWSSNDFQCDVYVYESEDGFIIHVADNQLVWDVPLPEHYTWEDGEFDFDRWHARHLQMRALLDDPTTHRRIPIKSKHAGKTYTCATAGEAATNLRVLQLDGLQVPEFAIEALVEEHNEELT
jgi:hypothetical protein